MLLKWKDKQDNRASEGRKCINITDINDQQPQVVIKTKNIRNYSLLAPLLLIPE